MFNFSDKSIISDIGKRNSEAVKKTLKDEYIQVVAEEIGGNKGRTMIFKPLMEKLYSKLSPWHYSIIKRGVIWVGKIKL